MHIVPMTGLEPATLSGDASKTPVYTIPPHRQFVCLFQTVSCLFQRHSIFPHERVVTEMGVEPTRPKALSTGFN